MTKAGTGRFVFEHWFFKPLENSTVYQMGADFKANQQDLL